MLGQLTNISVAYSPSFRYCTYSCEPAACARPFFSYQFTPDQLADPYHHPRSSRVLLAISVFTVHSIHPDPALIRKKIQIQLHKRRYLHLPEPHPASVARSGKLNKPIDDGGALEIDALRPALRV